MLRVEHFLELSQFLIELLRLVRLVFALANKSGRVVGVDFVQMNFFSWIELVSADVDVVSHLEKKTGP